MDGRAQEGARLRELALMAQRYAEANRMDKAEEVLGWSPVLQEARKQILGNAAEEHDENSASSSEDVEDEKFLAEQSHEPATKH